jgi:hypothetical protein
MEHKDPGIEKKRKEGLEENGVSPATVLFGGSYQKFKNVYRTLHSKEERVISRLILYGLTL